MKKDTKLRYIILDGHTEEDEDQIAYKLIERDNTDPRPIPTPDGENIFTVSADPQYTTSGQYYCSKCGEKMPGEEEADLTYDKKRDMVQCQSCKSYLKVGDADRGVDSDNPGDLDWTMHFVCPICETHTSEEDIDRIFDKDGEQIELGDEKSCWGPLLKCPHCNFVGSHEGCMG